MQAVILAAGAARRLRPLTDKTPKCLLNVGGKSLLQRTIDNITSNGITEFVFVTGYLNKMIEEHVRENNRDISCEFLHNADFENNNNSYSLWMTRNTAKGSILLLDSDILFDKGIITELLECGKDNALAVNSSHEPDEEQMKVVVDSEGVVTQIGKHIPLSSSAGESIGIELFSPYFVKELYAILNRKIILENNVNEFYETSFQEVIDKGEENSQIHAVDVSDYMCMEIDTAEDFARAQDIFNNK
ncbi:MAG: phosphocholine cytidylyltransferase family protein [Ignavibacteria bacterium]|nr:phosphocholine cytidylyltransferase family protein [Ignavibacteria bacterium]